MSSIMTELDYLYGEPLSSAVIKKQVEDFQVDEILDIELTGEGEHVCLQVVKKGENTAFVAKQIARCANVPVKNVSYAGIKDRHGVCTQWFSVPVPIKEQVDFSQLNSDSIFIVNQKRHNRKLRTGCHKGNRFTIKLRSISNKLDILSRVNAVRQGVPNYFGEQRFGHDAYNLELAHRLFNGEQIRDRKLRGLVLSAARSHIFNQVVSARVKQHGLAKMWHEEVFLLDGSNAFFTSELDEDIIERVLNGDILLSGPMVGKGEKGVVPQERALIDPFSDWVEGLSQFGLKMERRALRLIPKDFTIKSDSSDSMTLSFTLPKGAFATSLLRELVKHSDGSVKQHKLEE